MNVTKFPGILIAAGFATTVVFLLTSILLGVDGGDLYDSGAFSVIADVLYAGLFILFFLLAKKELILIEKGEPTNKTFRALMIIGIINVIIPAFSFAVWLNKLFTPPKKLGGFKSLIEVYAQAVLEPSQDRAFLLKLNNCSLNITALITVAVMIISVKLYKRTNVQ